MKSNPLRLKYIQKALFTFLVLLMFGSVNVLSAKSKVNVNELRTEYKVNPIGLETLRPRLFWKLASQNTNVLQSAYQIKAASTISELKSEKDLLWNSDKVNSDKSIQVAYKGKALSSGQKVYWQVRIWDNKGNVSGWSEVASFEMGLLNISDWKASWIEPDINEDETKPYPSPLLRKEIALNKEVKLARIYATCHGLYQINLNGKKVGDEFFTPGWTSYHSNLQYQVYDVTSQLQKGENAIGVILGDGWYRGPLVWQGNKNLYGKKSGLLFQMEVTFTDGSKETIVSDNSWKASTGAILKSEIYDGELYEARLEEEGWDKPSFDDSKWNNCIEKEYDNSILTASVGVPVRITQELKPIQKIITPKGELVFDFGQNMVGWVNFKLQGEKGSKITIQHAEVLDQEGNFYIDNLRVAQQKDQYIFKGKGVEEFQPHFTFHGFRYIKISDYKGEVTLNDITGKVIHSDMDPIGDFECSDTLVNRLQKNIQWGLRGNFLDVPTDCPQRDERLGWTGDAQVFASTACFNMNAAPFYTKWMKDFIVDQKADGSVPWVVPNVVENGGGTGWSDGFGATGWADAAVIIPWTVYQSYGDTRILENQYESMKAWEEYMIKHSGDRYIFDYGFHFGDWLAFAEYMSYKYNAPDYGFAGAHTDKDLIATAYYYYTTGLMQKIATILGKDEDAKRYESIRPKIKGAFKKEYVTATGRLSSNTQTAYILALSFGIMPDEFKETAAQRLADNINELGHLTTGFLGTPLICQALSDNGYPDIAYMLLFNKRYPSWLYPVTMGATTIWERWDGIKPDGSFQDVGMNSFNHYAYGAVGNWLYTQVAGIQIDPENPGYKHVVIKPQLSEELTYAKAQVESLYGEISSHWQTQEDGALMMNVTIPSNTTASVYVPTSDVSGLYINGKEISKLKIKYSEPSNGYVKVELGSGKYQFKTTQKL